MIPILYPANEVIFDDNNGIGALSDSISCKSTEVLNGMYELELVTPYDGNHANAIEVGMIIKEKPNYLDFPQPFRVYCVEKNLDGTVTVKAEHWSYDTNGLPIYPYTASKLSEAVDAMNSDRNGSSIFVLVTDFEADGELKVDKPASFRSILSGNDNSILGVYGGDYHYDLYDIELLNHRGVDRGICIRSGKNLVELEHTADSQETYSAVFGYWKEDKEEDPQYVYSDMVSIDDSLPYEKVLILEATNELLGLGKKDTPTKEQINDYIESYIESNNIGSLAYSLSIKYADDVRIREINLGDTVTVLVPELGIKSTARCSKVVFDCLLERNESVELGSINEGITGEVASLSDGAKN